MKYIAQVYHIGNEDNCIIYTTLVITGVLAAGIVFLHQTRSPFFSRKINSRAILIPYCLYRTLGLLHTLLS